MLELKSTLERVFQKDQDAVREFAYFSRDVALAYLKYKIKNGDRYILSYYDRLEDLAWDCIADLFERDEDGHFSQLETYFINVEINEIHEGDLVSLTRRLIFSKVNDGLFRNHKNFDRSLSKIIRNLKLAAEDHPEIDIAIVNNRTSLVFDIEENDGPSIPPEILEAWLFRHIEPKLNTKDILELVVELFRQNQMYSNSIPVVWLAQSIRHVYAKMNREFKEVPAHSKPHFFNGELTTFIEQIIDLKREDLYASYVETGKIPITLFDHYLNAVVDILHDDFIKDDPVADSYFEHLKKHLPQLEKATYREEHRQYLEYLVKIIRKDFTNEVKKEFLFSATIPN